MGGIPYQTERDIAWFFLRGSWVTGWRVKLLRDFRGHSFWDVAVGQKKPANRPAFFSVIPLTEILSEILKVGPGSKKVMQTYHMLLDKLGSEFKILNSIDTNIIEKTGAQLLGEAIKRM